MSTAKKVLKTLAIEGVKYAADQAKSCYPVLIHNFKNRPCKSKFKAKQDAATDAVNNISAMVQKKYDEIANAEKKIKAEKKKGKKKAIKCSLIAGGSGLVIGGGVGYLIAKNNQIIKSDYVYKDDMNENKELPNPNKQYVCTPKTYVKFKNGYLVSTDGTTLLKKVNN